MTDISEEAIRRNEALRPEVGDFTVWQFVTRGPGRWTHTAGPPTVCVKVSAIDFGRFARFYNSGIHGVIPRTRSYSAEALDPKVKHYSRMNFNLAELEVADIDPEAWPVLTDADGNLTEGIGYNAFVVTDGVIRTPGDRSILQGVSRGMVIDLARQLNIPWWRKTCSRTTFTPPTRPSSPAPALRASRDSRGPASDWRRESWAHHSAAPGGVE